MRTAIISWSSSRDIKKASHPEEHEERRIRLKCGLLKTIPERGRGWTT